jgi:hypothetical protein
MEYANLSIKRLDPTLQRNFIMANIPNDQKKTSLVPLKKIQLASCYTTPKSDVSSRISRLYDGSSKGHADMT